LGSGVLPKRALTDAGIQRLKPPASGQVDCFDQGYPGLALRMSYGGGKTFVFFYRLGGRLRRLTLGTYPAITLAEARESWRKARHDVQAGRDPARTRSAGNGATDFQGVFEEWLRRDQANNRSVDVVRRSIKRNVLPYWQHRQITDIGRRDVLDVIDAIADRGAIIMARRIQGRLHRLFKWAVGRGVIEINPLADLPMPGEETRRDRVLKDGELIAVWNAAKQVSWPYGPAFQLLILTGARREEIGQLRWSEIEDNTVKLEGARTKNGEPHHIPLSAPSCAVLHNLPRIAGSDFVFTSTGKKPLGAWSREKAKIDDISQITSWRIHDLRRTTATGLQKQGVPLQVTEAILGHTAGSRGGIIGVYQRHDYANEKRAALEAWGAHVLALVEGRQPGKVIPINATI
jgi:integrase